MFISTNSTICINSGSVSISQDCFDLISLALIVLNIFLALSLQPGGPEDTEIQIFVKTLTSKTIQVKPSDNHQKCQCQNPRPGGHSTQPAVTDLHRQTAGGWPQSLDYNIQK
jgi:hypothetical protein